MSALRVVEQTDPRTPPHDLGAEESLLGAMLLSRDALEVGLDTCEAADFYQPSNGDVFDAMARLARLGMAVDHVTVTDSLRRAGELDKVGGEARLVALAAAPGMPGRAEHYARIVAEHHTLRRLAGAGHEIAELAYDKPLSELPETMDRAEGLLSEVVDRRGKRRESLLLGATIADWYDRLAAAHEADTVPGVATEWHDLDAILGGLRPGQLITVGARPGMGKTALACQLALNVAGAGRGVLFVSAEMSRDELQERFAAIRSGVDQSRIRNPRKLAERDWSPLTTAVAELEALPVHVDDDPGATVLGVRSVARRIQRDDIGLVIVDYLQLMTSTRKAENRQVEVAEMSRGLKRTALELGVPIVALAQLNRAVEARSDKRPTLADLRESGAVENDSDVVMFLYRDDYYRPDREPGVLEVIIAKHRNGPTGTVKLFYDLLRGRIANMSRVER